MKIAVYPGSFNPWHEGHSDILIKSLNVFDKVVILISKNENKILDSSGVLSQELLNMLDLLQHSVEIKYLENNTLLADHCKNNNYTAVIRGLRNSNDLEYEKNMLYWNEDLGLNVETVYFISDRKLSHISSSAIRGINGIK